MSDELSADYAQPVDITRAMMVARIVLGFLALGLAVWLTLSADDQPRHDADMVLQARAEATQADTERDRAVTERNAAITQLETLKAGGTNGIGSAGIERISTYLATITAGVDALRTQVVSSAEPIPNAQLLTALNDVRQTADEARQYVEASGPAAGATPTPTPTPDANADDDQSPTTANSAAAAIPDQDAVPAPSTKRTWILAVLAVLGVAFTAASGTVLVSRADRPQAVASETIKLLLGVFAGMAGLMLLIPG